MKNRKKIICFDIDGVICSTKGNKYRLSKPKKNNIKVINNLYRKYRIIIFTSRFMGRNKENIQKAKLQGYKFTLKQLKNWRVNFHKLIFGKPSYDLFIDDKSLGFSKNWKNDIKL
jgi:histidinol phosphatase-like enzyme